MAGTLILRLSTLTCRRVSTEPDTCHVNYTGWQGGLLLAPTFLCPQGLQILAGMPDLCMDTVFILI